LTAELVRRGWITAFQGEQLVEGHAHKLTLGPYLLLEVLGEGGMGKVFKALHRLMKRLVALKLIRQELLPQGDTIRRFQREIQALAQLAHPNIVTAYHADQVGDCYFLVMEYVEGTDLQRLVKERGDNDAPTGGGKLRGLPGAAGIVAGTHAPGILPPSV
jgi:serine/threonine protein kinase